MTPRGLAVVEAAKADGSWTGAGRQSWLCELPCDLDEALAARPAAAENFERFSPSVKRMILEWLAAGQAAGDPRGAVSQTSSRSAAREREAGPVEAAKPGRTDVPLRLRFPSQPDTVRLATDL